ncbi:PTS sugar transporter subunit IIA [Erwinia sp. E_sp_B04_7]|uniref:PTS sugar transporter subunit IIA n=1 Tax=unclassified Erwinia TaxID=2622719 RepID=UPI0030CC81CD
MNNEIIPLTHIRLQNDSTEWREAVISAGELLVAGKCSLPAYTDEMLRVVEEFGPYIVVAPGIALAHARPSASVLTAGLSLITLSTPVAFGHEENDPVWLVIALCAPDKTSHLALLAQLVSFLDDENNLNFLKQCDDAEKICLAINKTQKGE